MKRRHFESLGPVCPVCRANSVDAAVPNDDDPAPLEIAFVEAGSDDDVLAGGLVCTRATCRREFPIVDGIPILVPNVREFVAAQAWSIHERRDLTPGVAGLLGDCAGPDSSFETNRRQVGSYAADHYDDLAEGGEPSAVVRLLESLCSVAVSERPGPRLDVGCAVGRSTFELAERDGDALVLGIDANFAMLRVAGELLRTGRTSVPRRRIGVVHESRTIEQRFRRAENVDFWACDAHALPFRRATFARWACLNVLDCVANPAALLSELGRLLVPGGIGYLASPYDWATSATPFESWLGGHSQRSPLRGDGAEVLRALLEAGATGPGEHPMRIVHEFERLPWTVRIHDRSRMHYDVHALVLQRLGEHDTARSPGER